MSASLEIDFFRHLFKIDSMEVIAREGIDPEILPTEDIRNIYDYALKYYFDSSKTMVISEGSLRTFEVSIGRTMMDVLDDLEVTIDEPDLEIYDLIMKLKGGYIQKTVSVFNKSLAMMMAEAPIDDRLKVASSCAMELIAMVTKLEPKRTRVGSIQGVEDRIYAYEHREKIGPGGMALGLTEVDAHIGLIKPGELALMAAYVKTGKAQPITEPVLTPSGWKPMGRLRIGDEVIGATGLPTKVLAIHPQGNQDIYRVTTYDGASVEVSGDHLWTIRGRIGSTWNVVTTLDIQRDLDSRRSFSFLPVVQPVEFEKGDDPLPLDPYLLGVLLGDGCFRQTTPTMSSADPEIPGYLRSRVPEGVRLKKQDFSEYGYSFVRVKGTFRGNVLTQILKDLHLWGRSSLEKHIPSEFLFASVQDRLALLQGLMDTDGYVESRATVITLSSLQMIQDIRQLVYSLGGVAKYTVKKTKRHDAYVLRVSLPSSLGCPFRLKRKAHSWMKARDFVQKREPVRRITKVSFVGIKKSQCITVEASDGLYVTKDFLVTHNSILSIISALAEWRAGRRVALFTLENSIDMTLDRLICAAVHVDSMRWERNECTNEETAAIYEWRDKHAESSNEIQIISPEPEQRTPQFMLRLAHTHDCNSVIIDQLSHVRHPSPGRKPRNEIVADIVKEIKEIASTNKVMVPVLLLHQINRVGKAVADKVGYHSLGDLAESAETERSADFVFSLYQGRESVGIHRALFQILASRRTSIKAYDMLWIPGLGHGSVLSERIING